MLITVFCTFNFAASDELQLRADRATSQLLVMNSGSVVRGQLTQRPGGFDVALNPGRMFVADTQIRFKATDISDAYNKLRGSIQDLTPTTHIELARWCIDNRLPSFAKKELLDALYLNPDHSTARLMLERLTREEQRTLQRQSTPDKAALEKRIADNIAMRDVLPERRSLGGLPQHLAVMFTRRIQPLLSNKCGNARCHSPGRNDFAVASIRRGSSAVIAEQNLAAVLTQIDYSDPNSSPLLSAASGLHGGSRQLLFPGTTGRTQVQQLRDWVAGVAEEIGQGPVTARSTEPSAESSVVKTARNTTAFEDLNDGLAGLLTETHETVRDRRSTQQKLSKEAVIATRQDKFDPDVFNRQFHGQTAVPRRLVE